MFIFKFGQKLVLQGTKWFNDIKIALKRSDKGRIIHSC